MRTITKFLAISFSLSLLLSAIISCEAEDDNLSGKPKPGYLNQMPEETSIGANTFGCYVNGELVAARGRFQEEGIKPYLWEKSYVNGFWEKYENDTTMKLHIISKHAVFYIHLYGYPHLGNNNCSFYVSLQSISQGSGSIDTTINLTKFDPVSYIISGHFNDITVPLRFPSSVANITDGQFDIKYGQNF